MMKILPIERSELENSASVLEQEEILNIIEEALNINRAGFNIYLVDSFSNKKLEDLIKYVKKVFSKREKPRDICYVTLEDARKPTIISLRK